MPLCRRARGEGSDASAPPLEGRVARYSLEELIGGTWARASEGNSDGARELLVFIGLIRSIFKFIFFLMKVFPSEKCHLDEIKTFCRDLLVSLPLSDKTQADVPGKPPAALLCPQHRPAPPWPQPCKNKTQKTYTTKKKPHPNNKPDAVCSNFQDVSIS